MSHEHTWVNTLSGVTCIGCPERIEAPECEHDERFVRIDDNGQSVRKVVMQCKLCDRVREVLTTRTEAEIMTEVEKV